MERLFLIILLNFIFYFRTLRFGYVSDDMAVVGKAPETKTGKIRAILNGRIYFSAPYHHLYMLLTHTTACVLIYLAFGSSLASFLAAVLFSINPSNNAGAICLSARLYTLGTIVVLLMWWLKSLSVFFYLSGVLLYFSHNYILAPLLFIGTPFWSIVFLVPFVINLNFFKTQHRDAVLDRWHNSVTPKGKKIDKDKINFVIKSFAYYFAHCFFPRRLGMYHDFHYAFTLHEVDDKKGSKKDIWFYGGIVLLSLCAYQIIFNFHGLGFGLFWFCLFISQYCHFIPMTQPFAERYVYLANAGLMLALAHGILSIPFLTVRIIAITAFIIYYATRMWLHMGAYKNNKVFLEYNIYDINHPDCYHAWLIKGEREACEDLEPYSALTSFRNGLHYNPRYARFHFQIATLMSQMGHFQEALWHFKECVKLPMATTGCSENEFHKLEKSIAIGLGIIDKNGKRIKKEEPEPCLIS